MMGHNMFLWRNMTNYCLIIPVTPSYLLIWSTARHDNTRSGCNVVDKV